MSIKEMIQKAKDKLFGKKGQKNIPEVKACAVVGMTERMEEAKQQDETETVLKILYQNETTENIKEVIKVLAEAGDTMAEAFEQFKKTMEPCVQQMKIMSAEIIYFGEPWIVEKMKKPNNERKRKKIPMVRSRAYIQNRKNMRRSKRKK